ncbi:ly6/PLAUR domain-containing protein 1 isoform X1 [Oryzias latipes]|uniref:LY6/PLAUR domain containing 1 n=1 Tax=Oryzias latipes TaxID=8090 RepID=A0A3B3IL02_ORYLA|nr:ly6/PLAUR domain-containing protein 1 isoform X1 [Oryzias latipes]
MPGCRRSVCVHTLLRFRSTDWMNDASVNCLNFAPVLQPRCWLSRKPGANPAFLKWLALQIQCYQCEEMTHDCSTPEFIVNCTVNVQDTCQKEVLVKDDGMHYRKSCASSGACLIASSGYQQFCTGKLNSVCITCCNTPLCNGPRQKKRPQSSSAITINALQLPACSVFVLLLLVSILC